MTNRLARTKPSDMAGAHRNMRALTGLRAIAAVWVITFHYRGVFSPIGTKQVASALLSRGYLGVDLFFILSGFVIWHVHAADFARPRLRSFLRFMCLRAARLYPVYAFTLMLFAVLVWITPQFGLSLLHPSNYPTAQFILHLLLVQSWGFAGTLTWNYPSWSVSAEWFCYLFFPFAALGAARLRYPAVAAVTALLFATICTTYFGVFDESLNQAVGIHALLRALPEFLLGCLLRELASHARLQAWPWTTITLAVSAIWGASFFTPLPASLTAIPFFAMLILAGSVPGTFVSSIGSWRPLVAIGAASYSVYLMQAPVQKVAQDLHPYLSPAHPLRSAGIVAIYLIALGISALLVHRFIEDPSRRWLRARIDQIFPHERQDRAPAILVAEGIRPETPQCHRARRDEVTRRDVA